MGMAALGRLVERSSTVRFTALTGVILSEKFASPREANSQSKDPVVEDFLPLRHLEGPRFH